jgi:hypothetical protein
MKTARSAVMLDRDVEEPFLGTRLAPTHPCLVPELT